MGSASEASTIRLSSEQGMRETLRGLYSPTMAYPEHYLFQYGGSLLNGAEQWTAGLRFAVPGGGTAPGIQEADSLEHLMTTLSARFGMGIGSGGLGHSISVKLEWGKFNKIGTNGRYADPSNTNVLDITPVTGGSGSPASYAPQLAYAVSFGTERTRGPGSKGRTFVPMPGGLTPVATGRISGTAPSYCALHWGYLIDEMNNFPGLDLSTVVACVVSNSGNGHAVPITTVRCGDVLDTMRSRRNALTEVYAGAAVKPDPA